MGGLTPLVWMLLVEGIGRPASAEAGQLAAGSGSCRRFCTGGPSSGFSDWWEWRGCICFAAWFRNRPEEKPEVNAAELAWIRGGGAESVAAHARTPWMRFLTSRNLQALCLMYACQSYGWYFYITYLPEFLERHYDVPASSALGSLYKGGPLWLGAVGCLLGGLLTDRFVRRTGNLRWGRRLFGVVGHSLTGLCFLACLAAPSAFWFFVAISLAGFSTDLAMGAGWAVCQDIGQRHAAVVAGFMNMVGNLGGAAGRLDVRLCPPAIAGGPCRPPRRGRASALGGGENRRADARIPDHLPDLRRRLRGWRRLLAPHRPDRGRCSRGG